jgi:putative membrane protein
MDEKIYDVDPDTLIIRDHLAIDRTSLANERTFLAYVRTAMAFAAGGFGLIKLFETQIAIVVLGWIAIVAGSGILVYGIYRFFKIRRTISKIGCESEDIKVKEEDNSS